MAKENGLDLVDENVISRNEICVKLTEKGITFRSFDSDEVLKELLKNGIPAKVQEITSGGGISAEVLSSLATKKEVEEILAEARNILEEAKVKYDDATIALEEAKIKYDDATDATIALEEAKVKYDDATIALEQAKALIEEPVLQIPNYSLKKP